MPSALSESLVSKDDTATTSKDDQHQKSKQKKKKKNATSESVPLLYDPEIMVHMEKSVAQAYITLLCGGGDIDVQRKRLNENRMRRSAITAGFLAITERNVVEACFGLSQQQPTPSPQQSAELQASEQQEQQQQQQLVSAETTPGVGTTTSPSITGGGTEMDKAFVVSSRTLKHIKRMKVLLSDIAFDTEDDEEEQAFCKLAVMTFLKGFEIVLLANDAIQELNVCTKCVRYGRILRTSRLNLQRTFRKLQTVVLRKQHLSVTVGELSGVLSVPPATIEGE